MQSIPKLFEAQYSPSLKITTHKLNVQNFLSTVPIYENRYSRRRVDCVLDRFDRGTRATWPWVSDMVFWKTQRPRYGLINSMEHEIGQPDLLQERSNGTSWWNLFRDSTQIYEISSMIKEFNEVTKVLVNNRLVAGAGSVLWLQVRPCSR